MNKALLLSSLLLITIFCKAQDNIVFRPDIANRDYIHSLSTLGDYLFAKDAKHSVKNRKNTIISKDSIKAKIDSLNNFFDIEYNEEVQKYIDLFTESKRYEVELMLGINNACLPLFEKELAKLRLPDNLKYLPLAISAVNPTAVSTDGAVGIWQMYYTTGKIYNLKINTFVDERRSPERSTKAAARYLKDMYKIYYDWGLAIAAYACGPANVNKAIARSEGNRKLWDIYSKLPTAKREVIPSFIAALYLVDNYEKHNINPAIITPFPLFDTVTVKEKLHLGQVAGVLNLKTKQLAELNEVYRKMIIHPSGKYTILKLPKGYKTAFIKLEDSIYNYMDTIYFKPIPEIVMAPEKAKPTSSGKAYTPPNIEGKTKLLYTVKSGDNLGFIASWYGVKITDLKYWNNIYRNRIVVGDKLNIYHEKSKAANYSKINTMTFEQKQSFVGKTTKEKKASDENNAVKLDPNFVYHKVRSGDNPWIIAKQYPGVSAENIEAINGWSKNYKLYPGQYIKIKRK